MFRVQFNIYVKQKIQLMRKIKLFFVAAALCISAVLQAQNITVTGIVSDATTGEPIPFAALQVKGTKTGTSTNANGEYSISASSRGTIVFSSVGYEDSEVAVNGNSVINVALNPDVEALEGTVVVGYGTAKSISSVVGSASTVKKEVLQNRPVASVGDVLQGQVAGLQVFTSSGEPSATVSMRLRGVNSINASNTPLYVLDGSPVSASIFTSLNPNDIENITVLKDASSTAIYGSRAANGVVFITTRKGSQERATVRVNANYGVSNIANYRVDMCNTEEYFELRELINPSLKDNSQFQALKQQRVSRPDLFNFSWKDWILNENAPTKNIDLSISGRSQASDYYVSANAFTQEGIEPFTYLERYSLRSNVNSQVNSWLKIGSNIAITYQPTRTQGYSTGNSWYNPISIAHWSLPYTVPYEILYDEQGNVTGLGDKELDYFPESGLRNYFYLQRLQPREYNYLRLQGNTYEQIQPIKGLTLKASQAIEGYDYRSSGKSIPENGSPLTPQASEGFTRNYSITLTNTAEYKFSIGKDHEFVLLAGQEAIMSKKNGFGASSTGQTDIRQSQISDGTTYNQPSYSLNEYSYNSYFARANYDLLGRYSIEASFRRDGSSLFGANRRWASFWSVGTLWNMKKEAWLQDASWLNQLQLRVNYGTTGNSGIDNYLAYGLLGSSSLYQGNATWGLSQVANPDLTWETVTSANIGLNFRIFDKLSTTIDLYSKKTSDMLMEIPYSYSTGFGGGWGNVGSMTNKGVEFEFSYDIFQNRDWYVNASLNFGYNKNTITELFGGRDEFIVPNTGIKYQVGKTYGDLYYVVFRGVDPATGAPVYERPDGTLTSTYSDDDAQFTGYNRYAPWSGGLQLNATWRGLSLNATFSGVFGKYLINNDKFFLENPNFIDEANVTTNLFNIWTKPGDVTDIPGVQYPVEFSSRFIENASFVRLKNLQISYSLPQHLLDKTGFMSGLRLYAIGRNLLTFTNYSGIDPEVDSNLTLGAYPNTKQYSVGIEITF